jgi:hypothetical protein
VGTLQSLLEQARSGLDGALYCVDLGHSDEYGEDQLDPSHPVHQRRQPAADRRGGRDAELGAPSR